MCNSLYSNKKKIRVLQLITSPQIGGIENQLLLFLQKYDKERFRVDVLCCGITDGPLRNKYLATGARLFKCEWSRFVVPYVIRLSKFLRQERYDVIHARTSEVSGTTMLVAKLHGIPVRISSYHHTRTDWRNPSIFTRIVVGILQWINRMCATKIISISEACLDTYYPDWRRHPQKFQICYNGVNTEKFSEKRNIAHIRTQLGLPDDCLVIGHVGSFRPAKNHRTLISVAERLLEKFDNVYFLLVGDGELRETVEKEAETKGIKDRIVFAGRRDDIPDMISAMDVFVMPSINEGFGTVVIEAQICGVPVVGSNLPCIREALYKGLHKFLCDPLDAKEMAGYVALLLRSPELRNDLGNSSRQFVRERFSIDKTVKHLEFLYSM